VEIYRHQYTKAGVLTNFIQTLTWSTFVSRSINILEFNNVTENLPELLDELKNIQHTLTESQNLLNVGMWPVMINAIDTSYDNVITSISTTYDMIIQRYIQSSLSTILSYPYNMTFDYAQSEIPLPYNIQFLNFIDHVRNTFYSTLNMTVTQFKGLV
jgi:hypothetical protein